MLCLINLNFQWSSIFEFLFSKRPYRTSPRNTLITKFLGDQKNFDIVIDLPFVMNSYNQTIHRTKKHTPYEIFYSTNKNLFIEVYNNTLEAYNKS